MRAAHGREVQVAAQEDPNKERFEFGQSSHTHAYLPIDFDDAQDSLRLIGASIINATNDIPLLGSNRLLERLQAGIDFGRGVIRLRVKTDMFEVPIVNVNGHLAVQISRLPKHACTHTYHEVWKTLSALSDKHSFRRC